MPLAGEEGRKEIPATVVRNKNKKKNERKTKPSREQNEYGVFKEEKKKIGTKSQQNFCFEGSLIINITNVNISIGSGSGLRLNMHEMDFLGEVESWRFLN